jgi:uncharacterized membrane protein YcaP (DUF421 family)
MFSLTVSWWEIVVRAAIIYVALFALIRITGKREVGEMTPFDLVFLLVIAEQVSPALTGGDDSVAAALIGLVVLLLLNSGVTMLTTRWRRAERLLESKPRLLVRNGKVDYAVLRREGISKNELLAAIRQQGAWRPQQVDWAVIETSGSISMRIRAG